MFRKGFFPQGREGAEGRPWPLPLFGILPLQRAVPELLWQRTSINVCWEWNISQGCLWGTGREGGKAACFGLGGETHLYLPVISGGSLLLSVASQYHSTNPALLFPLLIPWMCWWLWTFPGVLAGLWQHPCWHSIPVQFPWKHRNALRGAARRRAGMETVALGFFFPLLVLYPPEQ